MAAGEISKESVRNSFIGWQGYAKMGNTFKLRQEIEKELFR